MMSGRPDFVTECYGINNTEIKKESRDNSPKEQKVELAEDRVDEKNNSIAIVFAAERFANRNAKMVLYYNSFHSIFLGVAVICALAAFCFLFTKKGILGKLMSIFIILINGFIIYGYLFL